MAVSIDWGNTNVISVPQSDLTLVAGVLYDLDTDWFRLALKSLEDDEAGMPFPYTHDHNTEFTISGTTFARAVIIVSPYSVKFEDTGSAYSIRTVGSNNNILDIQNGILVPTPLVSYASTNSAGLIVVESADTAAINAKIDALTTAQDLTNEQKEAEHTTNHVTGKVVLRNLTTLKRWEADAWEDAAQTIPYSGAGLESVGQLASVAWS